MDNYILKNHLLDLYSVWTKKAQNEVAPLANFGPNNFEATEWLLNFRNFDATVGLLIIFNYSQNGEISI